MFEESATKPPITLANRPRRTRSQSWDCKSLQKRELRSHSGHRRPPACLQWKQGRNPRGAGSWRPPVEVRHLYLPFPKPWKALHLAPVPKGVLGNTQPEKGRQWPNEFGGREPNAKKGGFFRRDSKDPRDIANPQERDGAHSSPNLFGHVASLGDLNSTGHIVHNC